MAVIYEPIEGTDLIKAYSDTGHKIIQDESGVVYDEAVDPDFMHRTYTESEELIGENEDEEEFSKETDQEANQILDGLTDELKAALLAKLLGNSQE